MSIDKTELSHLAGEKSPEDFFYALRESLQTVLKEREKDPLCPELGVEKEGPFHRYVRGFFSGITFNFDGSISVPENISGMHISAIGSGELPFVNIYKELAGDNLIKAIYSEVSAREGVNVFRIRASDGFVFSPSEVVPFKINLEIEDRTLQVDVSVSSISVEKSLKLFQAYVAKRNKVGIGPSQNPIPPEDMHKEYISFTLAFLTAQYERQSCTALIQKYLDADDSTPEKKVLADIIKKYLPNGDLSVLAENPEDKIDLYAKAWAIASVDHSYIHEIVEIPTQNVPDLVDTIVSTSESVNSIIESPEIIEGAFDVSSLQLRYPPKEHNFDLRTDSILSLEELYIKPFQSALDAYANLILSSDSSAFDLSPFEGLTALLDLSDLTPTAWNNLMSGRYTQGSFSFDKYLKDSIASQESVEGKIKVLRSFLEFFRDRIDAHLLHYDSLTGLMGKGDYYDRSRSLALDFLSPENSSTDEYGEFYIDLGRLNLFNKQGNREYGDLAIMQAAQILERVAAFATLEGGNANVFRNGGDEFVITFKGPTQLREKIQALLTILNDPDDQTRESSIAEILATATSDEAKKLEISNKPIQVLEALPSLKPGSRFGDFPLGVEINFGYVSYNSLAKEPVDDVTDIDARAVQLSKLAHVTAERLMKQNKFDARLKHFYRLFKNGSPDSFNYQLPYSGKALRGISYQDFITAQDFLGYEFNEKKCIDFIKGLISERTEVI